MFGRCVLMGWGGFRKLVRRLPASIRWVRWLMVWRDLDRVDGGGCV